ncbi:MAG: ATP-binding protein [Pseudomonadota bacterium]
MPHQDKDDLDPLLVNLKQSLRNVDQSTFEKMVLSPETLEDLSPGNMLKMMHQLQVHQIELEMQNEELRRTQWQLDAARIRYFDLYDLAPVGYCTLDEQGMIIEANLMAARLLGCDRTALVKQPLSRFIVKADQDSYYLHRKLLLELTDPQSCELRMLNGDGTSFWASLASTYDKNPEGTPLLRMVMSDISERKKAAAERMLLDELLQQKNNHLEHAIAAAEKANIAKSDFLSNMSHELRTPLNAILGFAQLIEISTPPLTSPQKKHLDQILQAGWYLLDLINELLDLALIESGKLSLSMETVSVADVLHDCQTMIEPQARSRGITLHFPQMDIVHYVSADYTRLKQVIINLLSNAIKYNKKNGTVVVSCVKQSAEHLLIYVEDSGEGLSSEQIHQLFQPFNRLGRDTGGEEGTGIGLVMTKRLSELMGGAIGVESVLGQGSKFWIEINLTEAAQTCLVTDQSQANLEEDFKKDSTQHTLLYMENNPANLMLVEDLIARRPDLRLLTAVDANTGIHLARKAQPNIILMDMNLPGMNGIDTFRVLAEDPLTAHIPVIAVSANAIPRDIEKGLKAGLFRYLTKPINISTFMVTIDVALAFNATKKLPI